MTTWQHSRPLESTLARVVAYSERLLSAQVITAAVFVVTAGCHQNGCNATL